MSHTFLQSMPLLMAIRLFCITCRPFSEINAHCQEDEASPSAKTKKKRLSTKVILQLQHRLPHAADMRKAGEELRARLGVDLKKKKKGGPCDPA
jgi:hypothetical protein